MSHWFVDRFWYQKHPIRWLLYPLSLVFRIVSRVRRGYVSQFKQFDAPVPLIVVGNLSVGGVGKTPLVIALANAFKSNGLQVGIVSRGYGASVKKFPHTVQIDSTAKDVGDEPCLIAQKTQCPVVISPNRVQGVQHLIKQFKCQVILSDDGLQHYRMGRTIEIAVLDGQRGVGNGLCLPAGPLREPVSRLKSVDFVVVNGASAAGAYRMDLKPGRITHLLSGKQMTPDDLTQPVAAVAAIGNPDRFFKTLDSLGIEYTPHAFPDHHQFKASDLNALGPTILMTEKDAVKCRLFMDKMQYVLPVEAKIDNGFWAALWSHPAIKDLVP